MSLCAVLCCSCGAPSDPGESAEPASASSSEAFTKSPASGTALDFVIFKK